MGHLNDISVHANAGRVLGRRSLVKNSCYRSRDGRELLRVESEDFRVQHFGAATGAAAQRGDGVCAVERVVAG